MLLTLREIVALVDGKVLSGDCATLTGFEALDIAEPSQLSFYGNDKYLQQLRATKAGAVFVPRGFNEKIPQSALIEVDNPSAAFGKILDHCVPRREFVPGIHPSAIIHPTAQVPREDVCIGPGAIIEEGAEIGLHCTIGGGAYIGRNVKIGAHSTLHPRSTIMDGCILGQRVILHGGVVIGADGYGYEFGGGRHNKIEQIGIVRIDDDVEVGANSTIDRARFGKTWIGEGTKIDNQVQIGHNCVIGKHVLIIAKVGIAGSVRIGDYSIIAAQVGIAGHVEIGKNVILAARSGVTKSIPDPGQYMGFPAENAKAGRKMLVCYRRLPELFARVKSLESAAKSTT